MFVKVAYIECDRSPKFGVDLFSRKMRLIDIFLLNFLILNGKYLDPEEFTYKNGYSLEEEIK